MIGCPPDEPTLQQFIASIEVTPPRPHHSSLLSVVEKMLSGCAFSYATTRGGWYRPGGVIQPDGARLSDDVEGWLESELDVCGGDMDALLEKYAGRDLLVTRMAGQTHYLVAPIGNRAEEFIQLEIEEQQELVDRVLFDAEARAADIQEVLEPFDPVYVEPRPLGPSRYKFRRMTDMRQVLARQMAPIGGISPLGRFMAEWDSSRAASRGHFCNHWIVAVREHQDRYHNPVLNALPFSLHARKLKYFHWHPEQHETELADQINGFDRAAGYPSAWYFHMVAGTLTPKSIAYSLAQDLKNGFRYLAERDIELLEHWLDNSYSV